MRTYHRTAAPREILRVHTGLALITCTFALLTWALPTFGHDTPDIQNGKAKHISPEEVQQIVNDPRNSLSHYTSSHWHYYTDDNSIGGTPPCVADSYDPETDEYSRWDEETWSWDLSGCEGEDESSSSSLSSSDDGADSSSDDGASSDSNSDDGASSDSNDGADSDDGTDSNSDDGTSSTPPSNDGTPSTSSSNDGAPSTSSSNDGTPSTSSSNDGAPSNDGTPSTSSSNDGTPSTSSSNDGDGSGDSTGGPASTDATLSRLALSGYRDLLSASISISIGTFNFATTSYSASVDSDMKYILVDPVVNDAGASYYIPGGGLIVLADGSNVISITVTAEDGSTSQTYTVTVTRGAGKQLASQPDQSQLYQNTPNPFNSQTVISYFLQQSGLARLEIFALNGQRVAVLSEGSQPAGHYRFHWNGRDDAGRALASGIYLYRLMTTEGVLTRKLTLLQ